MTSARKGISLSGTALMIVLIFAAAASAQTLYKYRGDDGEWNYSDRPPVDGEAEETRNLESGAVTGTLNVSHEVVGRSIRITANNRFHAPMELTIELERIRGVQYPHPNQELRWVLSPRSNTVLLNLAFLSGVAAPDLAYSFRATIGDPATIHQPTYLYRVPIAVARDFQVTQAFPDVSTHSTPDSFYAVDMAMPIGTDIFAARGGIVIDVADSNFRAGLDRVRDAPAANVVRILHDDGTYAIYAHLSWNSIRVRVGDRVSRGDYIADSGNTGFSTGPHLHFAVVRNAGMQPVSVQVRFAGAGSRVVMPATGSLLTAY
jgi:murein DD-endopeptidase MepM/ murein hydrolase activator NlpD